MDGSVETPRPMLVEKRLEVNGYDIDVMGIVSNIVYVRWFEDLRFRFMDTYCPFVDLLRSNRSIVLARTEIGYRRALTIFDRPVGRIWVSGLRRARWEVSLEIESRGKINCRGRQAGYFVDIETKRVVRVPPGLADEYHACLGGRMAVSG
jgi:acyl-CoA thioester hydrolase